MSVNGSRVGLSKRLRYEVLRRDNYTCRYCGGRAPDVVVTVDHVIPAALGGSDDPTNLATACVDCNAGKSSVNPESEVVADVSDSALLYARAIDQVSAQRSREFSLISRHTEEFLVRWNEWQAGGKPIPMESEWRKSIAMFITRGLTVEDLHHFVDVAMGSKCAHEGLWKFFCKCCWNEIRTRVDLALELIQNEGVD